MVTTVAWSEFRKLVDKRDSTEAFTTKNEPNGTKPKAHLAVNLPSRSAMRVRAARLLLSEKEKKAKKWSIPTLFLFTQPLK